MSANIEDSRFAFKTLLRTADQYPIWKQRLRAVCWGCVKQDIFDVTDDQCVAAINAFEKSEGKDWVGKSWMMLTNSLHDDLFVM